MPDAYSIRAAVQADGSFLGDMVVEAANWRAGGARARHEILTAVEHRRYVTGWMRPADAGFVAIDSDEVPIGAAWYRILAQDDPGFGYVGTAVPELIIGVRPVWRAHGVGRALLRRLVVHARSQGHSRISLSVEHDNFAKALYRSEGFIVTESGSARDTMVNRMS
ncbi:GNAT family N-acetyltransferase [Microbacterium foliorum]|uniref:GNAT family N-acetyltransferase n=1 Tax=Microbacterium foliorum TaxID=104336 RepID=UPI001D65593E|nr:GNAT family N-acetyltransferase [Microbacterium foliorum]CAH0126927.1 Mycothiol acetyltransferase [Microbacterium foliorum]CAH0127166.1 Mycothiol acetyltransferase [Microbacterium foliorum]